MVGGQRGVGDFVLDANDQIGTAAVTCRRRQGRAGWLCAVVRGLGRHQHIDLTVHRVGATVTGERQIASVAPHKAPSIGITSNNLQVDAVGAAIDGAGQSQLVLAVDDLIDGRQIGIEQAQVLIDGVVDNFNCGGVVGADLGLVANHDTSRRMVLRVIAGGAAIAPEDHGAIGDGAHRLVGRGGVDVDAAMPGHCLADGKCAAADDTAGHHVADALFAVDGDVRLRQKGWADDHRVLA
ncbi:hypothetical protein D3C71_1235620 [compost metagenome]